MELWNWTCIGTDGLGGQVLEGACQKFKEMGFEFELKHTAGGGLSGFNCF
jgi:hypothetical protein